MPELAEIQDIIDMLGRFFEKRGLSSAIGKVFGVLHFKGPLTQEELKEIIGCSLSAVSQAISFLKNLTLVAAEKGEGRKKFYKTACSEKNLSNILQNVLIFEIEPMINLLNEKEKSTSNSEIKEKTKNLKNIYLNAKGKLSKIKEMLK